MPRGNVRVSITGDADGLSRATARANADLARFGDKGSKTLGALKVAAAGAGVAVGAFAIKMGKDSVLAAVEAEKSQARLKTQLDALNISFNRHATEIDRVIQKHSELSGLDDEDLQDALTNIVRVTGDLDKGFRLVGLAADIARAKHMDVAKAGELVGKVAGGNIGILARYGIVIKDGSTATEALGQLQQRFAGQAAAYGNTTAGSYERLQVAFENVQERLGKKLLPILTKALEATVRFIRQMETGRGAGGKFARTIDDIGGAFRDAYPYMRRAVIISKDFGEITSTLGTARVPRLIAVLIQVANPVSRFIGVVRILITVIRRLSEFFTKVADKGREVADTVSDRLAPAFRTLGRVADAALAPLRKAHGVLKDIAGAAGDVIGKVGSVGKSLNPFGSGEPLAGFFGQFAPFTGPLGGMGARSVDSFTPLASRFGLTMTSGYRPGDDGWHGVNRARDYSDGYATPGELRFAQFMARTFGGKLLELIHTPLGFGIKNGRRVPLSFWPASVNQDHYDHVHVALQRGGRAFVPGTGDGDRVPALLEPGEFVVNRKAARAAGPMLEALNRSVPRFQKGGAIGRFDATSYGPPWGGIQGTGVTATGVNLKGNPHVYGIAVDPSVLSLGSSYWVWPNPFGYKGQFKAFDTGGAIDGNRIDFYDWRGRNAQLGWGHKSVTVYRSNPFGAAGKSPSGGRRGARIRRNMPPTERTSLRQGRTTLPGVTAEGFFGNTVGFGQDKFGAGAALAALTEGSGDDLANARAALSFFEAYLPAAIQSGDPGAIQAVAGAVKQWRDEIANLTQATNDLAEQERASRDAYTATLAEHNKILRENQVLAKSQSGALMAAFLQFINGGIGGPAGLGRQFPSSVGLGGLARA